MNTSSHYADGSKKIVLAQPLSSDGHTRYAIVLGRDNTVYCTCKGWAYRRTCRHLTAFNAQRQPRRKNARVA